MNKLNEMWTGFCEAALIYGTTSLPFSIGGGGESLYN